MQIKKKYIEVLFKAVKGYKTEKMSEARIRDSFLRDLGVQVDQYSKDKTVIFEKFCAKNEDDSLKKTDLPDGKVNYIFEKEKLPELAQELTTLNDEEVEVNLTPQIKDFIENSKYETEPGESLSIDEVLALS